MNQDKVVLLVEFIQVDQFDEPCDHSIDFDFWPTYSLCEVELIGSFMCIAKLP